MPIEGNSPVDPNTAASHPGGLEVVDEVWDLCFPGQTLHREYFRRGCLNTAMVLDPARVAVYTDLNCFPHTPDVPAIRIVRQPLTKMTLGPPVVGQRLTAISVYWRGPYEDRWLTFTPVVTNCLTNRTQDISRSFEQVEQADWGKLHAGLRQISLLDLASCEGQWELTVDGTQWLPQPGVPRIRSWRSLAYFPQLWKVLRA